MWPALIAGSGAAWPLVPIPSSCTQVLRGTRSLLSSDTQSLNVQPPGLVMALLHTKAPASDSFCITC